MACRSSIKTGKLPFNVDTKQLKLIKPLSWMKHEYEKAEAKREHLLSSRGPTQMVKVKRKSGKIEMVQMPIPTAHGLVMK